MKFSTLWKLIAIALPVTGICQDAPLRVPGALTRLMAPGFVSSSTLTDTSRRGNSATLAASAGIAADAVTFGGTTSHFATIAYSANLNPTQFVTIAGWVNVTNVSAVQCVIHNGQNTTIADIMDGYRISISAAGQYLFIYGRTALTNLRQWTCNPYTNAVNSWTFFALSYQYPYLTSVVMRVNEHYFTAADGAWVDGNGTATTNDVGTPTLTNAVRLGVRQSSTLIQPLMGRLSGPIILDRKLSAAESLELMRDTRPRGAFR